MESTEAYLVGLRYPHHAAHSGYEGLSRYVGTPVRSPLDRRWLPGRLGRRLDGLVSLGTGRPRYSVGALVSEIAAAAHMLRHEASVYHLIYGDRDTFLVPRLHGRRGHRLVASFHLPPEAMVRSNYEWAAERLDAAILVSEYQRGFFESLIEPKRIHVVRHGVDAEFFRPSEDSPRQAAPTCISVGSHLRDFETLATTIAIVWESNPEVRFVLVGTGGAERQALAGLREDGRVRFLHGVDDAELLSAYQASSVAVFAFHDLTASISLLEAMACGLPIACTDAGGAREYLGEVGELCRPRDPEELAGAIRRLLDASGQAREATRARALLYDYRVVAEDLRLLYRGLA